MFDGFECILMLEFFPVFVEIMSELLFVWSSTNSSDLATLDSVHVNLEVTLDRNRLHFLVYSKWHEVCFIELF